MINYQMVSGFSIPQPSNLEQLVITPEGQAMGATPGWNTLIDPQYLVGGAPLNRADGELTLVSGGEVTTGEFSQDSKAFTFPGASYEILPQTHINGTSWSIFCLLDLTISQGSFSVISPTENIDGISQIGLRIAVIASTGNMFVYPGFGSNDARLSTEGGLFNERSLAIITFSEDHGLNIWVNSKKVASSPNDKRPLTAGTTPGQWGLFRRNQLDAGKAGMTGLLNIDLSAPENAGYRRSIERFLMTKYGIS